MFRLITVSILILSFNTMAMANNKTVEFCIIQTSDVHGCFFPYDFIDRKPIHGSMARISGYVKKLRETYGRNLILLENGDILQGQPTCYYCNYIKPESPNLAASVINYMGYNAQAAGNHDIETGHAVYDKWISEIKCPVLGANITDTSTGRPYLKPYHMIEREGVRIAIIGMLTPAIPNWLNKRLWAGLRFEEMTESAKQWTEYIKKNEQPDIIIGLFHSGWNDGITTDQYEENASLRIAKEVPGFDLILYGHDHKSNCETIKNTEGKNVLCINPSSNACFVSKATIKITLTDGKITEKKVSGGLHDVRTLPVDEEFMSRFKNDIDSVNAFVNRKIGVFTNSIYTRDSYFGNSAFCDLIHNLQLKITQADISFNAPLSFNACIKAGDVHVSDMFNLYRYENQIYTVRMTGKEIRNFLEMSYDRWVNTMKTADDHIMQLNYDSKNTAMRYSFKNLAFNFDSAAGIDYEVDVTKPYGDKIKILRMSDGKPFYENRWYKVAMNSYRGNGGGELMTKGAGIPHDSLKSRIIYESEHDQRYHLMKEIEKAGIMNPRPNDNWRFVPVSWTEPAIKRDRELLFGGN